MTTPEEGLKPVAQKAKSSQILHLFVLSAFALAQPIFDLLATNAEFFVARKSYLSDLVILTSALLLLPPALLVAAELIAGRISCKVRFYLHLFFVFCFTTLIVLPAWKRLFSASDSAIIGGALLSGLIFCGLYSRRIRIRQFVSFLSPAIIIFPMLFVYQTSPAFQRPGEISTETESSSIPVTILILDELTITTLMDSSHLIDPVRYPNFSALSETSYWFRNATAVSDSTVEAVPAIFTGLYPKKGEAKLPTSNNMPNNLFSFLHASHKVNAIEKITQLCHPQICEPVFSNQHERLGHLFADIYYIYLQIVLPKKLASRFPSVTQNWFNFNAPEDSKPFAKDNLASKVMRASLIDDTNVFMNFIQSIHPTATPTANIMHIVFPHIPFEHSPSGKKYNSKESVYGLDMFSGKWNDDEWATRQHYQRYLMQLAYVDILLGRLISRLKETDLYDESAILVVSDHGASYKTNDYRRALTATNFMDILPVVFMLKLPGQTEPVVSDRNVETIDVLPTIADAINRELSFVVDGQSALDNALHERQQKQAKNNRLNTVHTFPPAMPEKYQSLKSQIALLGSGNDDIYTFGPHQNLVGKPIEHTSIVDREGIALMIENSQQYDNIKLDRKVLPARVLGRVEPPSLAEPSYVAVVLNGVVRAITRTQKDGAGGMRFTAMLPDSSLKAGKNDIQAFFLVEPEE